MSELTISNEDTVHTLFFSASPNSNHSFWEVLCNEINLTLKILSNGYLWHRDEFKVCLPMLNIEDNCAMPMHLISTTCFGDNIEDEWFIIYLILEISKKYTDLIIQVIDSDGDPLLIEAADYLPSWADPERTENRVFISNNSIHLIPPHLASLKNNLSLIDALQLVAKYPTQTIVSPEIQNAVLSRIGQYPKKITESIHRGIVHLPLDIAAILTLQPSLIAPIVTTYCNHDRIDLKACRNIEHTDYAYVQVNFTKCLYAMLMHSRLIRGTNSNTAKDKKKELGLKITYGFQMLMKTFIEDIFSTKEFTKFKNNLNMNGYFKSNIEDSKEYNYLLENAKKYFVDTECPISTYVSNNVTKIMATDDFLRCKESLKERNITDKDLTEDSDDWLSIQPSQLNDMLNNHYGTNVKFHNEDLVTPETVTSKLADFLKQSSDFEGVDTKNCEDSDNESINFDADQFAYCLEKMMNLVCGDVNSSSDLDSQCEGDVFDDELDEELANKLNSYEEHKKSESKVMYHLIQSIKEEGLSGPSSNLLSSIGINKSDLLDSDDD